MTQSHEIEAINTTLASLDRKLSLLLQSGKQSQPERFIRIKEVVERVGVSKSGIYAAMQEGTFPQPVHFGRISLWQESEITEWMDKVIEESRAA